jgi:hypothetical protein
MSADQMDATLSTDVLPYWVLGEAAHAIEVDQPERLLRLVNAFRDRGEAYIVNFGDEAA